MPGGEILGIPGPTDEKILQHGSTGDANQGEYAIVDELLRTLDAVEQTSSQAELKSLQSLAEDLAAQWQIENQTGYGS